MTTLHDLRCATAADVRAWLEMWRLSPANTKGTTPLSTFCHDCTAEYQAEMTDAGRCLLAENAVRFGRKAAAA